MPQPGDLVDAADYAFSFRTMEPRPEAPRALLVLLHGVGYDEMQLASIGARVPDGVLVALPRGYRSISGGKLGWYRVGLSEDGLQVVEDEAEEARLKLRDFVHQLQSRFDLAPARTVVAGFSQGGMLATSLALTSPADLAAFALLCGQMPPEVEPLDTPRADLRHLHALVVHGRDDDTLPVEQAELSDARLAQLGIRHELRLHRGGHELTAAVEDDAVDWLARMLG
ncbi:MAG TPA: phospholipase [Lysobacter sp.]|nr:phospholipase [Lysobacter sp.]